MIDFTPHEVATLTQMVARRLAALERARELDATGIFDELGARTPVEWDTYIATYTAILNKLEATRT